MIVLGLTTSSPRGGVALVVNGEVRTSLQYFEPRGHGERLFADLEQAFLEAAIERRQLELIGCDVGPGSFTGLRVALSAAQGIALALTVPLVGVGSLEVMAVAAFELRPDVARVVAFVDAHKGELFSLAVDRGSDPLQAPLALSPSAALEHARAAAAGGALVIGEVVEQFAPGLAFRSPAVDLPDASIIASVAAKRLSTATPAALLRSALPVYGREPDAKPIRPPVENPALLDCGPDVGSPGRKPTS